MVCVPEQKKKKNDSSDLLIFWFLEMLICCSVTQSRPTVWSHGLQHTKFPCLSPSPGVYLNSSPSSQWYHPTISCFVIPFSSCLQSFPHQGRLFASGGQSIGASASFLPLNIQGWFPCFPRDSQESSTTSILWAPNSLVLSLLYGPTLTSVCNYWKNHRFDYTHHCCQSDISAF